MKKIISLLLTAIMLISMTAMLVYADGYEYEVIDGWQYIKGTNKITGYVGEASEAVIPENTVLWNTGNFLAKPDGIKYDANGNRIVNDNLRKLTISKNVEYNGETLSRGNNQYSNLEEVVLAEGVTEIPERAFKEFSTIKKITLPSTLKTIGDFAFGYDVDFAPLELEELRLPASLEDVSHTAFQDSKIRKIYVEKGYKADYIPRADEYEIEKMSADIYDCIIARNWTENVYLKGLTDLDMGDYVDDGFVILDNVLLRYIGTNRKPVIPSNVTRIAKYAFGNCNIETVTLSPNLEEIAMETFRNSILEYIEIPPSVRVLRTGSFSFTNLKELFIPKTVEKIEEGFVVQCKNLEKVTFEGAPDIGLGYLIFECDSLDKENVIFLDDRMVVPEHFWQFCMYRDESPTPKPTASPTPTPTPTASPTPTATPSPTVTPTPSPTTEPEKVIEVTTGNNIEVKADGEKVKFTDANPFIDENNRTQMPIRVLGETLGFEVNWDDTTKTATLQSSGTLITVKIGESKILKNQEIIQMDTVAKIINDRTYIPLRAIAEAVGYTVKWK